ncbi:hypothetical protein LCGC14_2149130 [marine sediment metagenome]|uniref:Uncharacterized protein n=1 Tax=marine sediment metagenome TaxID=412755 RepID=A0A0F9G925_9ZZZZ
MLLAAMATLGAMPKRTVEVAVQEPEWKEGPSGHPKSTHGRFSLLAIHCLSDSLPGSGP